MLLPPPSPSRMLSLRYTHAQVAASWHVIGVADCFKAWKSVWRVRAAADFDPTAVAKEKEFAVGLRAGEAFGDVGAHNRAHAAHDKLAATQTANEDKALPHDLVALHGAAGSVEGGGSTEGTGAPSGSGSGNETPTRRLSISPKRTGIVTGTGGGGGAVGTPPKSPGGSPARRALVAVTAAGHFARSGSGNFGSQDGGGDRTLPPLQRRLSSPLLAGQGGGGGGASGERAAAHGQGSPLRTESPGPFRRSASVGSESRSEEEDAYRVPPDLEGRFSAKRVRPLQGGGIRPSGVAEEV